jgi:RNA polymerase II elongation factor ELL
VLKDGLANGNSITNSSTETNPELVKRPLRERIIHLLAIRPYKKPELMTRLHKGWFYLHHHRWFQC